MYKILNSQGLGVAGRQNELIELALTYGFAGVEVDMVDLLGRHDALGKEFACQFLQSASTDMGTFQLPINLDAAEPEFQAGVSKLDTIVDLAQTLNCKQCYVKIPTVSKNLAFQENFEKCQQRLQLIGEKFAAAGIRVGVALQASAPKSGEGEFKFIETADEILTLIKTVGQDNIGLCLDCWEWVVGGGSLETLKTVDAQKMFTEVRLADVTEGVDLAEAAKCDRTALPGDVAGSFSYGLTQHLVSTNHNGPISVSTAQVTFLDETREKIVSELSKRLDQLIAGEDPSVVAEAEETEAGEETAVAAGTDA